MIDFEQLKIENQTLNEKIEERTEELGKLKRKKTLTVQILTHVREKLRFIEKANSEVQLQLSELEVQQPIIKYFFLRVELFFSLNITYLVFFYFLYFMSFYFVLFFIYFFY
jgi:hypothetical protein